MSGILYICGTPIGNLEDISLRALRILKEVDLIAAEDTRHTLKLLNFYEISTTLTSYHQHNIKEKGNELIQLLKKGKKIALVTDAGMPAISDPGEDIVRLCHENNITVTCVPSATAVTSALALSGLNTKKFIFEGFLPQNKKDRKEILNCYKNEHKTVVFYEAPHHLKKTLNEIFEVLGNRQIAVVREITKKYEEVLRFTLEEAISYYNETKPKGEYVIVMEGLSLEQIKTIKENEFQDISIDEHLSIYINRGLDNKSAMKAVAKDRGVSKSVIYSYLNKN